MLTTQWVASGSGSVAWQDFQHILEAVGIRTGPSDRRYVTSNAQTVVALDGDRVVGVAWGHVAWHGFNDRGFGPLESLPGPKAMLDRIAVLPEEQGRGVGRLLVRAFAAGMSSKECTHVALWVDQSMPREGRVKFFKSCGFRSIEGSDDDRLGAEITTLLDVTTS